MGLWVHTQPPSSMSCQSGYHQCSSYWVCKHYQHHHLYLSKIYSYQLHLQRRKWEFRQTKNMLKNPNPNSNLSINSLLADWRGCILNTTVPLCINRFKIVFLIPRTPNYMKKTPGHVRRDSEKASLDKCKLKFKENKAMPVLKMLKSLLTDWDVHGCRE